jgi:hypothetical protein
MEKPKITHKMVRRMSFMKSSFRSWKMSKKSKMQVTSAGQDRVHPRTMGDNDPNGVTSNNCRALRRVVTKLLAHKPSKWAQTDMPNRAKD